MQGHLIPSTHAIIKLIGTGEIGICLADCRILPSSARLQSLDEMQ